MNYGKDEHEIRQLEERIDKKMRDLQFRKGEILDLNIRHIQEFVWSFTKAYENGDMQRCGRILDIMITLSHNKEQIPTLQEYFGGERIARYKGTIHIDKASEWITYIGEIIIGMTEWRIEAEPID